MGDRLFLGMSRFHKHLRNGGSFVYAGCGRYLFSLCLRFPDK